MVTRYAEQKKVDPSECFNCVSHKKTALFHLCVHEKSEYSFDGKSDYHTVQHMRQEYGECGEGKVLFQVL